SLTGPDWYLAGSYIAKLRSLLVALDTLYREDPTAANDIALLVNAYEIWGTLGTVLSPLSPRQSRTLLSPRLRTASPAQNQGLNPTTPPGLNKINLAADSIRKYRRVRPRCINSGIIIGKQTTSPLEGLCKEVQRVTETALDRQRFKFQISLDYTFTSLPDGLTERLSRRRQGRPACQTVSGSLTRQQISEAQTALCLEEDSHRSTSLFTLTFSLAMPRLQFTTTQSIEAGELVEYNVVLPTPSRFSHKPAPTAGKSQATCKDCRWTGGTGRAVYWALLEDTGRRPVKSFRWSNDGAEIGSGDWDGICQKDQAK
ncbi:hypothetical protein CSPAE12_11492, partial [Colletotrichum incanum]